MISWRQVLDFADILDAANRCVEVVRSCVAAGTVVIGWQQVFDFETIFDGRASCVKVARSVRGVCIANPHTVTIET